MLPAQLGPALHFVLSRGNQPLLNAAVALFIRRADLSACAVVQIAQELFPVAFLPKVLAFDGLLAKYL